MKKYVSNRRRRNERGIAKEILDATEGFLRA